MPATIWPLIKIILVFSAILLGIRGKAGIGFSILLGSLLLALLFQVGPLEWLSLAMSAMAREKFVLLAAIVLLILYFSDILKHSGQGQRLMDHIARFLVWPRPRLVFFPALIGLLPMPGGAIFSAPMLKEIAAPFQIAAPRLVLLNYWFRHIWELCWPLYPGIILAAAIAEVSIFHLLALTWPGLVLTVSLGWWFFLRPAVLPLVQQPEQHGGTSGSMPALLREAAPLLIAVLGALGLEGLFVLVAPGIAMEWGFLGALLAAMAWLVLCNGMTWSRLKPIFISAHALRMLFLVAAIFIFKEVLDQGGVVTELAGSVTTVSALFWLSMLLPLVVGLISGLAVAFVGGTVPLIFGLALQLQVANPLGYVVLALFSGYIGLLASPLHICLILSCQYFHTRLDQVLRQLVAPCLWLWFFAMGYSLLLIR